jgi:hypothetical protein
VGAKKEGKELPASRPVSVNLTLEFQITWQNVGRRWARRSLAKALSSYYSWSYWPIRSYSDPDLDLAFWQTDSGMEVDFILNDREVLIAVKSSTKVHETDLKGLTQCAEEGVFGRRILVCREVGILER